MAIFVMFGKYSSHALQGVSSGRTRKVENLIARHQGEIKQMYILLGDKDLVLIVDLPSVEEAVKVSSSLTRITGISFSTSPAISVDDFDTFLQVGE